MDNIRIARELLCVAKLLYGEFGKAKDLTDAEKERAKKKIHAVHTLSENIQGLRNKVTRDLKSDDERTQLTALVVAIMDKTAERVGNDASAEEDHVGITGLKKKHIRVEGSKVMLNYTGKSSVEHEKEFTNEAMAKILSGLLKRADKSDSFVMVTEDGFKIKADRINRYLDEFDVTAKDIRGYSANRMVIECLKRQDKIKEENDRHKKFNEIIKKVAERVGHGPATLRKHYLLPDLEKGYVKNGKIMDLKEAD